jgi:6-phosphofructokinase 1
MNAAIRAVVRTSIKNNYKCFGIYDGYNGLLEENIKELTWSDVSGDIIKKGGTIIGTSRCNLLN